MSLPLSYSEESLASYMNLCLGTVASFLGYSAPNGGELGSYAEQVNQVLLECGAESVEQISDRKQARALAEMFAWRKACGSLATHYSFMVEGNRYERNQVFEQAAQALRAAETAALPYLAEYKVDVLAATPAPSNDPLNLG